MINLFNKLMDLFDLTKCADFLAPLGLRIYLFFPFWVAGTNKFSHFDNTAAWFGNPDWGLGLPFPELMVALAAGSEVLGSIALLIGFGTRWMSIPLMGTMIVATFAVHWKNGWFMITDPTFCLFNCEPLVEAQEKLSAATSLLERHGNYDWLTSSGEFVILNNGIEMAVTYFVMLLALMFIGGGKYVSVDYWIAKKFRT